MPSPATTRRDAANPRGKRTLQRLRREAGYASAKEFAAALHIPNSTYSRYERAPEGPNSGIPLPAAWAMADELGVSIDLVVGRDDIDAQRAPTLDDRARRLSRSGREMLDDFMRYLEFREATNAARDWR